jgi:hypothetical protein
MSGKFIGNTALASRADLDALWNTTSVGTFTAVIVAIQNNITTLQGDVVTNTADIGTAQADIATLFADIATINGEIATMLADIATLFADIATLNGEIATINGEITAIDATLASLQSQIDALTASAIANPMTTQGDMIMGDVPVAGVAPAIRLPADLNGKILVMWGTPPVPTWLYLNLAALLAAGGGVIPPPKRVPFVYLPTGSYAAQTTNTTAHTVSAGVTRLEVEVWGGGGGGDPSFATVSGGGGGAYAWASLPVTPGDVLTLVVAGNADQADGADSSVNATLVVAGGGKVAGASGGAGGVGSGTATALLTLSGEPGSDGVANDTAVTSAAWGGSAPHGGHGSSFVRVADGGVGVGGGGQRPPQAPGGGGGLVAGDYPGQGGMIIVWEFQ